MATRSRKQTMKGPKAKAKIQIRLDKSVLKKVDAVAEDHGFSRNAWLERIITKAVR